LQEKNSKKNASIVFYQKDNFKNNIAQKYAYILHIIIGHETTLQFADENKNKQKQ